MLALPFALAVLIGSQAASPRDSGARAGVPDSIEPRAPLERAAGTWPLDYLWVLRSAIRDPAEVARTVARARAMGVRGLLVQVVARGDACYRSELLPRAEFLADTSFDPLGELLPAARAAGLEVHAWINCTLVWSAPRLPRDPRHVLRAHPGWVVRLPGGRPMAALTLRERRRLCVEGVFLSAAQPEVRTWIARVAAEIGGRYPVDGIHLDYIRQPALSLASDPMTRAGFMALTGVDPAALERLPSDRRGWAGPAWDAWRAAQVTAIVREVRDSLARVRPGLTLSAAVLPDTSVARLRYAQSWTDWVRAGLLDRAFVMCYAPRVRTVDEAMQSCAAGLGTDGRIVPGIAVYNSRPAQAAAKIRDAVAIGYPALAIYSYDSVWARTGYWAALRRQLSAAPRARPAAGS